MHRRARSAAAAFLFATIAGCSQHPGRLLVVVQTDLGVPEPLGLVTARATIDGRERDAVFGLDESSMPLSFVVAARNQGDVVDVRVEGLNRGATPCVAPGTPDGCSRPISSRTVRSSFAPNTTRTLALRLSSRCRPDLCPPPRTCDDDGACVAVITIDGERLPIAPGRGSELEVGLTDVSALDAATADGAVDAPGMDTPGVDAPEPDVPGLDTPGIDTPSSDTPDVPGLDAAADPDVPEVRCVELFASRPDVRVCSDRGDGCHIEADDCAAACASVGLAPPSTCTIYDPGNPCALGFEMVICSAGRSACVCARPV